MAIIDSRLGRRLSLKEIWDVRDAKGLTPKNKIPFAISEASRRKLEIEMGRIMSTEDIEHIIEALASGRLLLKWRYPEGE